MSRDLRNNIIKGSLERQEILTDLIFQFEVPFLLPPKNFGSS